MVKTGDVTLRIELTEGEDPELLERLTHEIREELLQSEVAEAIASPKGEAPTGSKGLEYLEIGALSLQLFVYSVKSLEILKKAVESRHLKATLESPNGNRLNLATAHTSDQDRFLQSV